MTESPLYHLPEDIRKEFRVDQDGKVYAKSIRAIARLVGRSNHTIAKLLTLLSEGVYPPVGTYARSESLKPFLGMDLKVGSDYPDTLVYAILCHYAHEAVQRSEQALELALVMGAIGIRSFFQEQLGWHKPTVQPQADNSKIELLMSQNQQIMQMLGELTNEVKEWKNTKEEWKGVEIINHYANSNYYMLPPSLPPRFSLKVWVKATWNETLTRGELISLGRHVAASIRTLKQQSPEKYGTICIYSKDHHAGLMTAWIAWNKEGRK